MAMQTDRSDLSPCLNNEEESAYSGSPSHPEEPQNLLGTNLGMTLMICGVFLPIATICSATIIGLEGIWRLVLLHPLETLTQILLVLCIPLGNYLSWHALCHGDYRRPRQLGIMNGIAIGSSLSTAIISLCALFFHGSANSATLAQSNSIYYIISALVATASGASALSLCHKLSTAKLTRQAKLRTCLISLTGSLLALLALGASECRPALIKYAQFQAGSDRQEERQSGLKLLRFLWPEKEMRMAIADSRVDGLSGLFYALDPLEQERLYFAATGKPAFPGHNFNATGLSADYISTHLVGAPLKELSLIRSAIHGKVHPRSLSATLDWSMVFKNRSGSPQEARAEISLAEGAVVSGLTLWVKGKPERAAFGNNQRVSSAYRGISIANRDPALITDLGQGRYLLQASPIPAHGELKLKLTITQGLKPESTKEASLILPRFKDNNFSLSKDNDLKLRANSAMALKLADLKNTLAESGEHSLSGTLRESEIAGGALLVRVQTPEPYTPVAVVDPFRPEAPFLLQTLSKVKVCAPKSLVVVVDGSAKMNDYRQDLITGLKKLPTSIQTTILLANDSGLTAEYSLSDGLNEIERTKFSGGKDNLPALIKGAELAGEHKSAALLWVHGAQPAFNKELFIMAPYLAAPSFYEIALDDTNCDINEFLTNHKEIGPFNSIARNGSLAEDLGRFFRGWQQGVSELQINYARKPFIESKTLIKGEETKELMVLAAYRDAEKLLRHGRHRESTTLAVAYRFVNSVTGAVVLEAAADYKRYGLSQNSPQMDLAVSDPFTALANSARDQFMDKVITQLNRLNSSQSNPFNIDPTVSAGEASANRSFGSYAKPTGGGTSFLTGATTGTIIPQGSDAGIIMGVNTASTVRVNNLANAERLINIFALAGQLVLLALGLIILLLALFNKTSGQGLLDSKIKQIGLALILIGTGISIPGALYWLLASARDANFFS